MADGNYWLSHDAQDIDDTIDEVQAARGSEASLSARLAEIVSDFEADQQRQDAEIATKAKMDNVYGYGDAITSNSNLNDYTQSGSYYCPNSAVAGSLTNSPITNAGFRLVVESITNTAGRFIQTIHANGNDGCFYQRKQTSQGMSPWYKFEGTQVASSQSAASLMQAGRLDAELTDAGTDESEEEER